MAEETVLVVGLGAVETEVEKAVAGDVDNATDVEVFGDRFHVVESTVKEETRDEFQVKFDVNVDVVVVAEIVVVVDNPAVIVAVVEDVVLDVVGAVVLTTTVVIVENPVEIVVVPELDGVVDCAVTVAEVVDVVRVAWDE
ncbi:hypothetical protein HDU83_004695 [Entophlyctis luteolus]|nr:hypothetical protein HDU83_004695 [Entophlyctis luteolus]